MCQKVFSEKDLLVSQFVINNVLDFDGLVNRPTEVKGFKIEDGKDLWLEALLLQYKDLYYEILMEYPITKLELFYLAVFKRDLSLIYDYAYTYNIGNLIATQNYDAIVEQAKILFKDEIPQGLITTQDISAIINAFEQSKKNKFFKWVDLLEGKIKSRRQTQQQDDLYVRLKNRLSKQFLLEQINQGDINTVIVNTCVKLENLLKNKYHYDGDLFTMISSFIEKHSIDKKMAYKIHQLRMKRNSIVHADTNNFVFSTSDLIDCITFIENLE